MKIADAIRLAMKETRTTQVQMAKLIGAKSQTVISGRLVKGNLTIASVLEMLDALNYELVVQPKKPGRRPTGQILIGGDDE